jgi:hypothetical protein
MWKEVGCVPRDVSVGAVGVSSIRECCWKEVLSGEAKGLGGRYGGGRHVTESIT